MRIAGFLVGHRVLPWRKSGNIFPLHFVFAIGLFSEIVALPVAGLMALFRKNEHLQPLEKREPRVDTRHGKQPGGNVVERKLLRVEASVA